MKYPDDLLWSAARTEKGGYALTVTSGGLQATMVLRDTAAGLELAGDLNHYFIAEMENEDLGMGLEAEAEAEAAAGEPE